LEHEVDATGPPRYRFGVFEFDARLLELRREGREVHVRPQALELLALVLEQPNQLIDRETIRQALWGDETFVDFDQGVNHCIRQLRSALGDDAQSPRYIQTLPRRGYRFIAPVEVVNGGVQTPEAAAHEAPLSHAAGPPREAASSAAPAVANWRPAALIAGLAAAVVLMVVGAGFAPWWTRSASPGTSATLAVAPLSSEGDPALGVGLALEIARRLGRQQALPVRPARIESGSPIESRAVIDAARAAGASLVLGGEVSRNGHEVIVLATLLDVATGATTWSQRLRVRADEIFSVEDVIAERVVGALNLRVAASEQQEIRRRYTSNGPAYESYLHGRAALAEYTPEGTERAVRAFEGALTHDPAYTLARAGLAAASADMYLRFAPPGEVERWGARAETEARAALDLDASLAEAHLARAAVARKREFDWGTAISSSQRALVLNPGLDQAHFFMAAAYYHLGYMEEALMAMERGRRLHGPDTVEPLRIEALVALFSGRFAPARVHLEEVSRRSSQPIGDTYLALALYYSGNVDRGREMLEALSVHPSASTAARSGAALAGVLARSGQPSAARDILRTVLAREYRDHHVAYSLGAAYAQLNDEAQAIQWLRTASDTGFPCVIWFERDPLLEPIRGGRAFADLLAHASALRESTIKQTPSF
jgi:DNA-binding winged helix-turn-helix (wHTH) protein/TolB-like protein